MARIRRFAAANIIDIAKQCSKCGESRLLDQFCKDKNASDGLASTCRICHRASVRNKYKTNDEWRKAKYAKDRERNLKKLRARSYYTCNICKIERTRDFFEADESNPSGLHINCCKRCATLKICPECKIEKSLTDFFKKGLRGRPSVYCKKCQMKRTKKWRSNRRIQVRRHHIRTKYDLSWDAFEALHSSQGGKCAICRNELHLLGKDTCVDHCHTTGKVRGILCLTCNSGLGYFKDNCELIESAAKYLKERMMK